MPEEFKTYKVGNKHYDVPKKESEAFLKDFKDAKEYHTFTEGKDTFDVPASESEAFRGDKPNAKPLYDYGFQTTMPTITEGTVKSVLGIDLPKIDRTKKAIAISKPNSVANTEPTRWEEFKNSLEKDGITNTIAQVYNYFVEPEKNKPITKIPYKPVKASTGIANQIIPITREEIRKQKITLDSLDGILRKKESITALGDTIHNYGEKNRFIVPQRIKLDDVNVGVRSRKDETEINTSGAIFSTFKKWRQPNDGWRFNFNSFLAFNKETNRVSIVSREAANNLDNNKYLITGTYTHDVREIDLSHSNYNPGIKENTLGYIGVNNSKNVVPVFGVGNQNELGVYKGGKVILTTSDYQHPEIIYGSAKTIKMEVERYKKEYEVSSVKLHEADGKSYAQMFQTKNKKITSAELRAFDNANSDSAESGSFIYFK